MVRLQPPTHDQGVVGGSRTQRARVRALGQGPVPRHCPQGMGLAATTVAMEFCGVIPMILLPLALSCHATARV